MPLTRVTSTIGGSSDVPERDPNSAAARYQNLAVQRAPFLERAREVAEVTIPALMPPEGTVNRLYTPFQSVGSRGVNNLAAKLLLALLPPGEPFFRLKPGEFDLNEFENISQDVIVDARGRIEKALGEVERSVTDEFEVIGLRTTLFEALKHLIVTGNGLLYVLPKRGGVRFFRLDEFVVVRDNEGNELEIIIKEELSPRTVPDKVRAILQSEITQAVSEGQSDERTVELYTRVIRRQKKWVVYQEVLGQEVPDTRMKHNLDELPWIPLRLTRIDGEAYGRGLGEEMLGDLQSLESLSQSVVEYGAAASKILFMMEEGGSTDPDDLLKPSGSIINGRADDVSVLSLEKFADMRFVFELIRDITRRLELSFLLNAAVQRDAERVTAEEIRFIAQELEDTLGGVYSILSQELQLPLVRVTLKQMQKERRAPRFDDEDVRPTIVTGLEALGRNRDLIRMEQLVLGVSELFGPEQASRWIKVGPFILRRATALGLDMDGVVRTEEEVNAMAQAEAQQRLIEQATPNAVNQAGQIAAQQIEGGQ